MCSHAGSMVVAITCIAGSPHVCSRVVPKSIDVAERHGLARLVPGVRQAETPRLLQQKLFKQAVLGRVGFAKKHMGGDVLPSHLQTKVMQSVMRAALPEGCCCMLQLLIQCKRWGHAVCRMHTPKQLQVNVQQSNALLHALPSALPQRRPAQSVAQETRC